MFIFRYFFPKYSESRSLTPGENIIKSTILNSDFWLLNPSGGKGVDSAKEIAQLNKISQVRKLKSYVSLAVNNRHGRKTHTYKKQGNIGRSNQRGEADKQECDPTDHMQSRPDV